MEKRGEKIFVSVIFLLIGAVVLAQLFLIRPDTRSVFTNADLFEGTANLSTTKRKAWITLETERQEPGLFVLVNGKKQESFFNKKITISVQEHSMIQVIKEGVNHPVTVEITGISDFVKRRNLNLRVGGEENIFYIGRILFQ
ncbi:MAG: hypothetical protein E7399_08610 [Ruminococcaceae bacterium]|nr:hypothetical protein [Oscillospiraceae bacterium]